MKTRVIVLLLLSALLLGALSPMAARQASAATLHNQVAAAPTQLHAAAFDKTRFVLHLAVAAYLIHYVYKKYKTGKLGRFHIITDIKAAAAALIAYHELNTAYGIAKGSTSKTLQAIVAPIGALTSTASAMASKLKHGDTSAVSTANSQESTLQSLAGKNGFSYKDVAPSGFAGF